MRPPAKHTLIHGLFNFSLLLKGFNGMWETLSGLLVLCISKATLGSWLSFVAYRELLEDPNDKVMLFITHTLLNPDTSTKTFAALYVLIHGLLNIFLTVQLYRKKHWAYGVTIWITLALVAYQIHRITLYHSVILAVFTVCDCIFVWLTWHEYRQHFKPVLKETNVITS